jgi:hypothetical protein
MARISKEPLPYLARTKSLLPRGVIVVKVASFTFRFGSIQQLQECIR